ncbi:hypothetical protein Gotur_027658 [Gossypium turneri]
MAKLISNSSKNMSPLLLTMISSLILTGSSTGSLRISLLPKPSLSSS